MNTYPSKADELVTASPTLSSGEEPSLRGGISTVTTAATANAMSSIFVYNRPLDYFAKLPSAYLAVTPEDVTRVARETIHPDQLIILAVGDKSKIEPGLKELNLAPIEYADPLGNILK